MLTKVFATGNGPIKSSINYMLSDFDHKGIERNPKPKVLEGTPELVQQLGDMVTRKQKYTAGSINFRKEEQPTEEQKQKIMRLFEQTFLAGLEKNENFSILWVEHNDKGRVELNFVIPDIEIKTGRPLKVSIPGPKCQQTFRDFDSLSNHMLGYEQVQINPLKLELNKMDMLPGNFFNQKDKKEKISEILFEKIMSGKINNRDELIQFFGGPEKFNRIGDKYLTLKSDDLPISDGEKSRRNKSIRLKGPLFEAGADYKKLIEQFKNRKPHLTNDEARFINKRLKTSISYIKSRNEKNLSLPTSRVRKSNNPSGKKVISHPTSIRRSEFYDDSKIKTEIKEVNFEENNINKENEVNKKDLLSNISKINKIVNEKGNESITTDISSPHISSTSPPEIIPFALEIMDLETKMSDLLNKSKTTDMKNRIKLIQQINELQLKINELKRKQSQIIKSRFSPV